MNALLLTLTLFSAAPQTQPAAVQPVAAVSTPAAHAAAEAIVPVDIAKPAQDPGTLVKILADSAHGGKWLLVLGAILGLFVWGLRFLWTFWRQNDGLRPYLPFIAMTAGIVSGISAALIQGQGWVDVLIAGVLGLGSGFVAIGGQDAVNKAMKSRNTRAAGK